jgi:hypothetical protein
MPPLQDDANGIGLFCEIQIDGHGTSLLVFKTILRRVVRSATMTLFSHTVRSSVAFTVCAFVACTSPPPPTVDSSVNAERAAVAEPTMPVAHPPLQYRCVRTPTPPVFQGRLQQGAWATAGWTRSFEDIEGPFRETPFARCRTKMLWDETYFYIGAVLEETDLWATYQEHDQIVFHENDFEVFIDPDGDGREYYEIEVNVLGTVFDLYLHRPYREDGPAEHGWDASNMLVEVTAFGSINDPSDRDQAWVVELAVPWSDFVPPTKRADGSPWSMAPIREHLRRGSAPTVGDAWRVNFSRVQWDLSADDGVYAKVPDRPEHNWTWTPQWEINMHVPEHWGIVEFVEALKEHTP